MSTARIQSERLTNTFERYNGTEVAGHVQPSRCCVVVLEIETAAAAAALVVVGWLNVVEDR